MSLPGDVKIRLEPLGETFEVAPGTPLRDVLFAYGVEFPCGGHGRCRKCRVKLLDGDLPAGEDERSILTADELAAGWRLACRCSASADITLEIGQWETAILADDTEFAFTPRPGIGIAVDIGTTTLVAQLVDLETGHVLGVRSALNPQTAHGSDVMSRVQTAVEGNLATLTTLIRDSVGKLLTELVSHARCERVDEVVLVGNTVMHQLFCAVDPEPLSHYPFQPDDDGLKTFDATELGWNLPSKACVQFLPCLGGFVGSDILAGILATSLHRSSDVKGLLDLGTNGEVVFGNRDRILCASTAAGPAFEGGRISMGMRAATGAITEVSVDGDTVQCHVLGNVPPRGICGSGLVDVVAAGLDTKRIAPNGRFTNGAREWLVAEPFRLFQKDIRELQLAKGAIAAGARILLDRLSAPSAERIFLAGAFGNYVNRESALRIGLLEFPLDSVTPAGNTALLGAKLTLFETSPEERDFDALRQVVTHVGLSEDPKFQDIYVESMGFPA